jgi:carboxyl-terminal processing protease
MLALTLVLGFLGLLGCVAWVWFSPQTEQEQAQALFQKVCRLVETQYYEETLNHQPWERWSKRYYNQIKTWDDATIAIDTMLASLNDPYSVFMVPKAYEAQTLSLQAKLYGVGVQLEQQANQFVVVEPIEGSPAAMGGVLTGDSIVAVNGQSVAGLSLAECADKIRGERGTAVKLTLKRAGKTQDVNLLRDEIHIKQERHLDSLPQQPKVAYLRINSFISEGLLDELAPLVDKWQKDGKTGLVIDLRGNTGGLLSNATELADWFLDTGTIVSVSSKLASHRAYVEAHQGQRFTGGVCLLVDRGSASASEVFAAALQDNHRAKLVGLKTFGKGVVQQVIALPNQSGLNLTIGNYRTPSGLNIHQKGIQPDVVFSAKQWRDWLLGYLKTNQGQPFLREKAIQLDPLIDVALAQLAVQPLKPSMTHTD